MKIFIRPLITALMLIVATTPLSAQDVLSLYPLFTERDAVLKPSLEGIWAIELFGGDTLSIQKAGDNFYHLRYVSGREPSSFEGGLVHVGNDLLLDLYPVVPDTIGNDYYREHLVKAHTLYRARLEKDTLRLAPLNYRWFYDHVVNKKSQVSHVWSGSSFVLTAPTEEFRALIAEHAQEADFFQSDLFLHRIATQKQRQGSHGQSKADQDVPERELVITTQNCIPSFPYQDGWLGGDGNVSIPLGPSKTLWIFGDTFVGERDQKSRSGSHMVPNTVAITTCEPNKQSTIQYFWRDQYTNHPKPFFESFTIRYKYWLADAFMDSDNLYVVMQKIGPKSGASPDDIFNFSGIGMTLAKISDPNATRPDQWNVKLIPWSCVFDPDIWNGCLVKEGKYVYMFVNGENQASHLLRLHLDHIESPQGHVEYYATDGTWKAGTHSDDMKILIEGHPGQSVRYHADLKQWIMVCGPSFLENKIRIRTAPDLRGPWSEERVIYECPEQTPGSATYDRDNFCYLGREHIQFYDKKSHTLLITYDCNSADFSKLLSNMEIYSPRVLSIPLKK